MKNPFRGSVAPITTLHPLDEANFYRLAIVQWGDVKKVADMLSISPSHIYHRLRLLQLDPKVQEAFRAGTVKATAAFAIAEAGAGSEALVVAQKRSVRALRRQLKAG